VIKKSLSVDRYVIDTLMVDLVGHDHSPTAFLVYLLLYSRTLSQRVKSITISLADLAAEVGVSKSAVQSALRILRRRRLIRSVRATQTATPEHFVLRPWIR
jgi:DNA-binding GntR family transcriptional regulator